MIVDAFRGVVVDAERAAGRHQLPVLVLLRRQRIAAGRARALDAEQVVVLGRQRALAPARLVDRLGDRHRCGDTVLALRGDGSGRDLANERLLAADVMHRRRSGRRVVPLVVRWGCLRARGQAVSHDRQPGDDGRVGHGASEIAGRGRRRGDRQAGLSRWAGGVRLPPGALRLLFCLLARGGGGAARQHLVDDRGRRAVVDEAHDALAGERAGILVCVDGEVGQ